MGHIFASQNKHILKRVNCRRSHQLLTSVYPHKQGDGFLKVTLTVYSVQMKFSMFLSAWESLHTNKVNDGVWLGSPLSLSSVVFEIEKELSIQLHCVGTLRFEETGGEFKQAPP